MWLNVKRFSIGAILLASLSLLLQGCGSYKSESELSSLHSATKQVSGTVSDVTTNKPVSGASVTAYPIENGVLTSRRALSETVITGADGSYVLDIPISYAGSIVIEAQLPLVRRIVKMVFSPTDPGIIRAIIQSNQFQQSGNIQKDLNFASEIVAVFLQENIINTDSPLPDGFTNRDVSPENIQKAVLALETFFGPSFTELSMPAMVTDPNSTVPHFDTNTTKAQQDLLVSVTAINDTIKNTGISLADIVTGMVSYNGLGTSSDTIRSAITTATQLLIDAGSLPPEYVPSAAINAAISDVKTAAFSFPDQAVGDTTAPTAPTGLTAQALNAQTVKLAWTASTDDSGTVAGYLVYRIDGSGVYAVIDTLQNITTNTVTYTDSTAVPTTTYRYKIVAFDAARNSSDAGNEVTVTTLSAQLRDTTPPTTPAGLICNAFSDTKISISWSPSTKTSSGGAPQPASGYFVYRNSQIIATVAETTYIDATNIQPATEYTYYIKSFDANSNVSDASTQLSIMTAKTPGAALPAAPTNLRLKSVAQYNKVEISWSASATSGVTYSVYRGGERIASGITTTQYTDVDVVPNSSFNYSVTAVNADGESSRSGLLAVAVPAGSGSQTAPSVPQNFAVQDSTSVSATLTWAASNDTIVAGYEIYRSDSSGSNYVVIGNVSVPGFTDTTLVPNTTYYYQVKSYSSTGARSGSTSDPNPVVSVMTTGSVNVDNTTPPSAPTNLVSTVVNSQVVLTWTAPSDKSAAYYRVYRDGSQIVKVTTGSSYTDSNVTAGATYSYSVKAFNNAGYSSDFSFSTPPSVVIPVPISTYTLYGRVTFNNIGLPGVTLTLAGDKSASTITDDGGNYSFTNVAKGNYIVAGAVANMQLTPSSLTVFVSNANVSGLNFTAKLQQSVVGGTTYPTGSLFGGTAYPAGTIIGGVTYPAVTIIGGVTYTTATVIGGVTYPTGPVIGGVTYTNGVVIGGVTYPAGTVVGGVAFPPGTVTVGVNYPIPPSGTIIGGVFYPTGTVTTGAGAITYPSGTVIGGVTYTTGKVIGGVTFPTGTLFGAQTYPTGTVVSGTAYPPGTIIGGVTYPSGIIIGGVTYTTATVVGGVTYPTGTVIGGITYKNGVVIGGVTYPPGTVVGGVAFPPGTVTTGVTTPSGVVIGGVTYPTGTIVTAAGAITYPTGTVIGSVTYTTGRVAGGVSYPTGTINGAVTYPNGTVVGGVAYPAGTIIGGVTYPTGTVISGVTSPTATVIGGITYPTGMVIGGVTYTNGVVIGGVSYPPGTVVGGVAFPPGVVVGNITLPSGTVISGVTYPTGTVTTGAGAITYPSGTVIGGVTYASGRIEGSVSYPTGTIVGGTAYPAGTVIGGITYPSSTVIGGVTYPTATVLGGITYPTGTVIGGVTYPNGVVIGGVSYPPGTVVGGVAFPPGTVTAGLTYPSGTVISGVTYPSGTVITGTGSVTYPSGTVIGGITYASGRIEGSVSYPIGTILGGVTYPSNTVIGGVTYTTATVIGGVTYPTGTVIGGIIYPDGVVIGGTSYPPGTVIGGIAFPPGTATAAMVYPNGTVIGGVTYPTGTVTGGIIYPTGTAIGVVTFPSATVIAGVTYANGRIEGSVTYPSGSIIGGVTYPSNTVIGSVTYTSATVIGGVTYPTGTVIGGITYPDGVVIGGTSYPPGTVVGGIAFPPGTATAGMIYPTGTVIGGVPYPTGTVVGGVITPTGTAIAEVSFPTGTVIAGRIFSSAVVSSTFSYTDEILQVTFDYGGL